MFLVSVATQNGGVPAVLWAGPEKIVLFLMSRLKCKKREWRNGVCNLRYVKQPQGTS